MMVKEMGEVTWFWDGERITFFVRNAAMTVDQFLQWVTELKAVYERGK